MNPLILAIILLGIIGLTSTLLLSLNNIIKTIYYWGREITFIDYQISPKKIYIRFPNEALTSDSLSKDIFSEEINEKIKLAITDSETAYVPYTSMFVGIIDIFLGYRNVIGALENAEEEYEYDSEELELFNEAKKFDLPSAIHGTDTYNMYTKYTLYDLDKQKEIVINSSLDYSAFVTKVIENKSNVSYRTHYLVYKKVGTKEDGLLICELITAFNIGQDYQDLSNHNPLIDVQTLPRSKDA